tara:strand:+ start:521 stop:700 length:180 start_codon:yes stop_codon:yes gene_type:complete
MALKTIEKTISNNSIASVDEKIKKTEQRDQQLYGEILEDHPINICTKVSVAIELKSKTK